MKSKKLPCTAERLRDAEHLYIYEDASLSAIAKILSIEKSALDEYVEGWEAIRQSLCQSKARYIRHGETIDEICKTVPIDRVYLDRIEPELKEQRRAFLTPSTSLQSMVHEMLADDVRQSYYRLKKRPSRRELLELHKALSFHDFDVSTERTIHIFLHDYLPTCPPLTDDQKMFIDTLLAGFQKYVQLQMASGNR